MSRSLFACLIFVYQVGSALANGFIDASFLNKHYYYFDLDGNAIDSVNGKVSWIDNQYFWIASPEVCSTPTCPTVSYSSQDLVNWKYNGPLFPVSNNTAVCGGGGCGRPKVIYNERTKKFVYYGFDSFGSSGMPVFTSDKLTSGYTYAGNFKSDAYYKGYSFEDMSLAVIDGVGYAMWTGFNLSAAMTIPSSIWPSFSQTVVIQKLTDDFLNASGAYYPVIIPGGQYPVVASSPNLLDGQIESPDLFKRDDWFYMVGSSTCAFCNGTMTVAYRSKSWKGPWTRQIVESDSTCGGQAMGVATIPSSEKGVSSYLYQSDNFHTAPVGLSWTGAKGHAFWFLDFAHDGSINKINCDPNARTSARVPRGKASIPTTGLAKAYTDSSPINGDYWAESGIPAAQFYQTWTSSKSGKLSSITVNLAANSPTQNLSIIVFRYSNNADLIKPWYKWETLTQVYAGVTPAIPVAYKIFEVAVGASVKKGDRLGFVLTQGGTSQDLFPNASGGLYGYLMHDTTGTSSTHALFALNRRQVSYQGDGTESPVRKLVGRELKWGATVV